MEGLLRHGQQTEREIYMTPAFGAWLSTDLRQLRTDDFADSDVSPLHQVISLLKRYVSGADLCGSSLYPHPIRGVSEQIYELRTPDVRIIGGFWRQNVFIATHGKSAAELKDSALDLYAKYAQESANELLSMGLDEPAITEGDCNYVLQL